MPRARIDPGWLRAALMDEIRACIAAGRSFPTNSDLGARWDINAVTVVEKLNQLKAMKLIRVERFGNSRRITLVETGGQTRLPSGVRETQHWSERGGRPPRRGTGARSGAPPGGASAAPANQGGLTRRPGARTPQAPGVFEAKAPEPTPVPDQAEVRLRANITRAKNLAQRSVAGTYKAPTVLPVPRRCAFPVRDWRAHPRAWFCGSPSVEGRPYCAAHCEVAYQKRKEETE
jgi:hypothetical protein